MLMPKNAFKRNLLAGNRQLGIWCSLPSSYAAEAVAGCGFDWMLFDTEHSPGDPLTVLSQLQAVAPYPTSAIVRPASNDSVLIKRYLDIGAQTFLIPFVENANDAKAAVSATRYPPNGMRGISSLTRATGFGRIANYVAHAAEEICVLVQVETAQALEQINSIAQVEGVDGIFIGSNDLAGSLGFAGDSFHPHVISKIEGAISAIRGAQKPAGILTTNSAFAKQCIDLGCLFPAVAIDIDILVHGSEVALGSLRSNASLVKASRWQS